MANGKWAPNVSRYFAYTACQGFGFGLMLAIWVIYLQERRGLSLAQAALVDVTFFVTATLAEVPTGIVADAFGRKASMALGALLLGTGTLAWAYAPSLPLIMLAYVVMAVGTTFLSGASEAFLYETLQVTGRPDDYARLTGRANATLVGALALGSVASGLLAAVDLAWPLLLASLSYGLMLGVALTFAEPQTEEKSRAEARLPYGELLRQALAMLRARPAMRFPMLYLAVVPLAALMMETVFLQPQALGLGVPLAGVGAVLMAVQLTNVAGSAWSERVRARLGDERVLYVAPAIVIACLLLLAAIQVPAALACIALMGFVTSVSRPIVLDRIQRELSAGIRATMLSMQSLMATLLGAIGQPTLGLVADRYGLPATYIALAGSLSLLLMLLFWRSRSHFP